MITKVRLKHWKSHLDTNLEFATGVNALVGIMGSGKTSVVEAVCFALYGTFPALQIRKVALDDLVMAKPQEKKSAEVELEFQAGNDAYSIKRSIEKGKGTAYAEIRKNGLLIDVGTKNVTQHAEQILGMDYDLFSRAVYSEQNGIDQLLRLPKGQRMEQLDRMLQLDKFKNARDNAIGLRNAYASSQRELQKVIIDLEKEGLQARRQALQDEIAGLEAEQNRLAQELGQATKGKMAKAIEVEKTEGIAEQKAGLQARLKAAESAAREIGAEIARLEQELHGFDAASAAKLQQLAQAANAARNSLATARAEEKRLLAEAAGASTKAKHIREKELPKLEAETVQRQKLAEENRQITGKLGGQPDTAIQEIAAALEAARKEAYSMASRLAELGRHMKELELEMCPVCLRPMDLERRNILLEEKSLEAGRLQERLAAETSKAAGQEQMLQQAEQMQKQHMLNAQKLEGLANERMIPEKAKEAEQLEALAGQARKNAAQTAELATRLEGAVQAMLLEQERIERKLKDQSSLAALQAKLAAQAKERAELAAGLAAVETELKGLDLTALRQTLQQLAAAEAALGAKLTAARERLADRKELLEQASGRARLLDGYRNKAGQSGRWQGMLASFVEAVQATQAQLRDEFLVSVNAAMNSIWPDIYPYGDFEEIRLAIRDDYVLEMRRGQQWLSADGAASGGERSLAVLALRIAFAMAFAPKLKWLVLDEPTHNLDRNAIEHFSQALREKVPAMVDQVFLITHEEAITDGIACTYRLERQKELGEPTRSVRI
ncbi:MAG: SMC family ATPase [Candidatus Aenigmarchaeota archaeon]|nr:SMC family ATPase [Candidatus Aenigmarchaeota archaeon]